METGLVAAWEVRVGVIPGQPMPEHTKRWFYTSEEFEQDKDSHEPINNFSSKIKFAHEYATQMTNPRYFNWVELVFIWY